MTFLFPDGNIHLIALLLASEWDAFTGLFEKEPSIKAGQAFTSYRMCVAWADWRRIMWRAGGEAGSSLPTIRYMKLT